MARKSALPTDALDRLIDEVAVRARAGDEAKRPASRIGKMGKLKSHPLSKKGGVQQRRGEKFRVERSMPRPSPFTHNDDAVVRYANARAIQVGGGPMETIRLAVQLAVDVRAVARRERVGVLTVVSRALAGYLTEYDARS